MEEHQQNASPRTNRPNVDWNAIELADGQSSHASARKSPSNGWFATAVFVLVVLAAHTTLGYFGYHWIRSNFAPTMQSATATQAASQNPAISALQRHKPPSAESGPKAPKERLPGKLHWSRREGLGITPDITENWKYAGGLYYSTKVDSNGATVIELVLENHRPLRCKG